jgi:hypothetical protein
MVVIRGSGVFTLLSIGDQRTGFSWEEELTFPWWLGGPVGEWVARPLLTRLWRGNLRRAIGSQPPGEARIIRPDAQCEIVVGRDSWGARFGPFSAPTTTRRA